MNVNQVCLDGSKSNIELSAGLVIGAKQWLIVLFEISKSFNTSYNNISYRYKRGKLR